ncbi:MAG TPA: GAF domain-containing protein, partial [Bryobacteraceae bacterium]
GVTVSAGQMVSALARLYRRGELVEQLSTLREDEFLSTLQQMTADFGELLKTLDSTNKDLIEGITVRVLEATAMKIRDLLDADRATLFIVDRSSSTLWSKIAQHEGHDPLDIRIPLTRGLAGFVARTGEPLLVDDASHDPRFDTTVDARTGYHTRSVLAVPLRDRRDQVFAVAQLLNKKDGASFDETDIHRITEFARPLAIVLETCLAFSTPPPATAAAIGPAAG